MYNYLAEFTGTLFFVYVYLATGNPLAVGAALALTLLITSNLSGGHINPVITIVMASLGKIENHTEKEEIFTENITVKKNEDMTTNRIEPNHMKEESVELNISQVNESTCENEKGNEQTKQVVIDDLSNELCEVNFNLDEIPMENTIHIKNRTDMYYKMYQEARQKAKVARDLALSAYLEAKRIKNTYMLDDIHSSSSDEDSDVESSVEGEGAE